MSNDIDIDWSKAPEGATHYSAKIPGHECAAFWREQGGQLVEFWGEYSAGKLTHLVNPRGYVKSPSDCIPRPSSPALDGESLPPIGAMVRVVDNGKLRYGVNEQGPVIAHVEDCAVVRMSYGLGCFEASVLAPIRTPEQIAADQREAAIFAMQRLIEESDTHGAFDQLGVLYDAGLRFPEVKQPK